MDVNQFESSGMDGLKKIANGGLMDCWRKDYFCSSEIARAMALVKFSGMEMGAWVTSLLLLE